MPFRPLSRVPLGARPHAHKPFGSCVRPAALISSRHRDVVTRVKEEESFAYPFGPQVSAGLPGIYADAFTSPLSGGTIDCAITIRSQSLHPGRPTLSTAARSATTRKCDAINVPP